MCGISGVVGLDPRFNLDQQIFEMNKLVEHRGPDGEGSYTCQKAKVGLGHRRLAILDLSDAGMQPFSSSCGRFILIYNGEIYNFVELKKELISLNHSFSTTSDTEVLLASYMEWGHQCVTKFNGMWSFAIYDTLNQEIFCSRDRFGIKPFYYAITDNQILFGSEIKQLLPYLPKRRANTGVLMNYLIAGFENYSEETFFENVRQLPPSHNAIICVENLSLRLERYYELSPHNFAHFDKDDHIELYESLLSDSIKLRMRSDVQVGGCLSGGLDSSTIAAIAASMSTQTSDKFLAIHARSSNEKSDESHFASLVAKKAGINLCELTPTLSDFQGSIDEVIRCQEEPFGDISIFMQFFVMKKARDIGCSVLLDGQGGDETLLGYERYYPSILKSLPLTKLVQEYSNIVNKSKLTPMMLAQYAFYFMSSKIRTLVLLKRSKFIKTEYRSFLDKGLLKSLAKAYKNLGSLQLFEITVFQLPHLLRYEDKNSMWHSIEARLPFLDYRLVEAAISIDTSIKYYNGWSKYLLRLICSKMLTEEVAWRRTKVGFEGPSDQWLSSIENEMENAILNSSILSKVLQSLNTKHLPSQIRWRLYNVAKWEEVYSVEIE